MKFYNFAFSSLCLSGVALSSIITDSADGISEIKATCPKGVSIVRIAVELEKEEDDFNSACEAACKEQNKKAVTAANEYYSFLDSDGIEKILADCRCVIPTNGVEFVVADKKKGELNKECKKFLSETVGSEKIVGQSCTYIQVNKLKIPQSPCIFQTRYTGDQLKLATIKSYPANSTEVINTTPRCSQERDTRAGACNGVVEGFKCFTVISSHPQIVPKWEAKVTTEGGCIPSPAPAPAPAPAPVPAPPVEAPPLEGSPDDGDDDGKSGWSNGTIVFVTIVITASVLAVGFVGWGGRKLYIRRYRSVPVDEPLTD